MAQWLRLQAPNAGRPGSIPGQGTRSRMLQLRECMPQLIKKKEEERKRFHVLQLRPGAAK